MAVGLLISTKEAVKWTDDEKRLVDRATRMLRDKGLVLRLVCGLPNCPAPVPTMERDHTSPSGVSLVCGCRRHQLQPTTAPPSKRAMRKFLRESL